MIVKRATGNAVIAAILAATILWGCDATGLGAGRQRAAGKGRFPQPDPLPVQQVKAYPETVTGIFLPLADFEDSPDGRYGRDQVKHFSISPGSGQAACNFVVNQTRTGAGAMEITLPERRQLVFTLPYIRDFAGFSLLSMAVYSPAYRDDLQVTLTSREASWPSHRALLVPGWNTVLFDIRRLWSVKGFDTTDVRTLNIAFTDAAEGVGFNIDDIMLVNNTRVLEPVPAGMKLRREGLDYKLTIGGLAEFVLAQGPDGLWRLERHQAVVQLAEPGQSFAGSAEEIELLGARKIGQVSVLENNSVRVRLASAWFFPSRAGEWASMAVRGIRWEYTFYGDGRWVTYVELNNAGGGQIGPVRIVLPEEVASAKDTIARELVTKDLGGPVGRWSYMSAALEETGEMLQRNYLNPGKLSVTLAAAGDAAEGDVDKDGFDESQGCYFLRARAGHCRFSIVPPPGGLLNPVFRVLGGWKGKVSVNSEGLAIRHVAQLDDGSALFVLPGLVKKPTAVEVMGEVAPFAGQ